MASPENKKSQFELSDEELKIVAEADTGGRKPDRPHRATCCWSGAGVVAVPALDRVPAAFSLGVFVFNDTESRAIHLAFAVFLAFAAYPGVQAPRATTDPARRLVVRCGGAPSARPTCSSSTAELAQRPGCPTGWTSPPPCRHAAAARSRAAALGLPMVILAVVFLGFFRPLHARDDRPPRRITLAKGRATCG